MKINKILAFTLSEVLITMSIVGVVSALTVPTLMKNYQKKAQSVQFRKVVTEFTNAIDLTMTEEGKNSITTTSIFTDTNGVDNFVNNHLKKIKTCSSNDVGECFSPSNYKSVDGSTNAAMTCDGNSYVLANSAAICIKQRDESLEVITDTNGAEKPNVGGRDIFTFYIQKNGKLSSSGDGDVSNATSVNTCKSYAFGEACLGVLSESGWQMDY